MLNLLKVDHNKFIKRKVKKEREKRIPDVNTYIFDNFNRVLSYEERGRKRIKTKGKKEKERKKKQLRKNEKHKVNFNKDNDT